jgi:polyisoprenoid-binding protein YceI
MCVTRLIRLVMKSILFLPAFLVSVSLPMARSESVESQLGKHDWVVDSGHSSCVFRIMHANASWFFGSFDQVKGKVTMDLAAPSEGSVEIVIPVESIDTNSPRRDGHLKSPDFFNAKENPEIKFRSTSIKKGVHATLEVIGELSMAGKSQSVSMSVEHVSDGEMRGKRRGFLANVSIKRSNFGMTYGVENSAIGDQVELMVSLELTQPK